MKNYKTKTFPINLISREQLILFYLLLCSLSRILNENTGFSAAKTICSITSSESCRKRLIEQGVIEFLTDLIDKLPSIAIKSQCSLALGYLSELTSTKNGMIERIIDIEKEVTSDALQQPSPVKSNSTVKITSKWGALKSSTKDVESRKKIAISRLTLNRARESEIFTLVRYERPKKIRPTSDNNSDRYDENGELLFYLDEHDVLNFDFSDYFFENTTLMSNTAVGGISREISLQPSFPQFEERERESRAPKQLIDIPVDLIMLSKETKSFNVANDHFVYDDGRPPQHGIRSSADTTALQPHLKGMPPGTLPKSSASLSPKPSTAPLRDKTNLQLGSKLESVPSDDSGLENAIAIKRRNYM